MKTESPPVPVLRTLWANPRRLFVALLAIVLVGQAAPSKAEGPGGPVATVAASQPRGQDANDAAENGPTKPQPGSKAQVLVLNSGRVLQGPAVADERGFLVTTSTGRLYLPFEHVKLAAMTLEEAHVRLAESMPKRLPNREMSLAEWCLENGLSARAAEHLRAVVRKDPSNREAKKRLAELETAREAGSGSPANAAGDRFEHALRSASYAGSTESSLGSLARVSPASVSDFVTTIQPLLLTRCGSVRCHGGAGSTAFRLQNVRMGTGNNRTATVGNLDAVVRQLDSASASRTFLDRTLTAHGGGDRAPLQGPGRAQQQAALRRWIRTIVSQIARPDGEAMQAAGAAAPRHRTVLREPQVVPASGTSAPALFSGNATAMPPLQPGPANRPKEDKPRKADAPGPLTDPYDPADFNSGQPHQR